MHTRLLPVLFGLAVVSTNASAAPRHFLIGSKVDVSVELPENWRQAEGLFGLELVLLGPETAHQRPALSITSLGPEALKLDAPGLKANFEEYRKGREDWLRKRGGKSLSYLPLRETRLSEGVSGFETGYRYELAGSRILEKTFTVRCRERIFHLKLLVHSELESAFLEQSEALIRSFGCH